MPPACAAKEFTANKMFSNSVSQSIPAGTDKKETSILVAPLNIFIIAVDIISEFWITVKSISAKYPNNVVGSPAVISPIVISVLSISFAKSPIAENSFAQEISAGIVIISLTVPPTCSSNGSIAT